MPVAWIFLAAMLLLKGTNLKEVSLCASFLRNFWGYIGIAGHFWSLSIEEQFYLVWPTALLLIGHRRGRWLAATGVVFFGTLHWSMWRFEASTEAMPTWFYADGLLVGCFFALLIADESTREWMRRFARFCAVPALLCYLCFACTFPSGPTSPVENALLGLCISSTALRQELLISRILSLPPLPWLGRISYSIYIWQEPFMAIRSVRLFCTAMPAVCLMSYYCLEKPLNRVGHKLASRMSPYGILRESGVSA